MKTLSRILVVFALLFVQSCGSLGESASESDSSEITDDGDFVLKFEDPAEADKATSTLVQESEIAEYVVDGMNEYYALPDDINVVFTAEDPDGFGPYYSPEENTVFMPWPYLTADRARFASVGYESEGEIDEAVLADLEFTMYHEIGHAMISNLELPITGKEEDAVDSLAAVIITQNDEDGGDVVIGAADWFGAAIDGDAQYGFSDFADEHSLNEQRYVSLLCLVYGSDPEGYKDLVDPDYLPEERAVRCEAEYEQASNAWAEILSPYEKA